MQGITTPSAVTTLSAAARALAAVVLLVGVSAAAAPAAAADTTDPTEATAIAGAATAVKTVIAPEVLTDGDALLIIIAAQEVDGISVEDTGDGLLITLPAPLDGTALADVTRRAPDWLADLRYGYDALFLVPMPDVRINTTRTDGAVRLEFERLTLAPDAPTLAGDAEDDGSRLRLLRLDAVVRHRAGDSLAARAQLRHLTEDDPTDVQSLSDLAQVERALERLEQAISLYSRALEQAPGTAGLIRERAALLRERAPRVTVLNRFTSVLAAEDQLATTLSAEMPLRNDLRLGVRTERRQVDSPGVLDPVTGLVSPFDGSRLRIFAHADLLGFGPGRTRVRAHASGRVAGLGIDYALPGNRGTTAFGLTWHEPRWEFVEGIVHGGWRDRVEVRHDARQLRRFSYSATLGGNRYGLESTGALAHSVEFEFVARAMIRGAEPFVSLGYSLSTERFGSVRQTFDNFGNPFTPIGFSESEVHRIDLFVSERLTDYVQISASGGYSVDRLQERGPFVGASITWTPLPSVDATFDLNHSESSSSGSGGATTTASLRLDVRF